MNLFNNIEKFNYNDADKKCVSLEEYLLFEDERECEKYLIFKLRNNLIQELHEIKFEISQYDEHKTLVEKNVIHIADINAIPEELFVPSGKLKANFLCKTISFRLIYAKFDTAFYENDVLHANNFSFDKYREQLSREKKQKMTKKELKALKKKEAEEQKRLKREKKINDEFSKIEARNEFLIKEKKIKSKYLKNSFSLTNNGSRSRTVFANVVLVIGMLAVIGFSGWSAFDFKSRSGTYGDGDYDVYILSDDKVSVTKYYGREGEVTIPLQSKQKKVLSFVDTFRTMFDKTKDSDYIYRYVTKIDDGCFKNTKITKVNFQNEDMEIGKYAFENCKNLETVYGENIAYIQEGAFKNSGLKTFSSTKCRTIGDSAFEGNKSLEVFNAPNALVNKNALYGCDNIERIVIGNTNAKTIGEIFGCTNVEVPSSLKHIEIKASSVPQGFCYDLSKTINLQFTNPSYVGESDIYGDNRKFDYDAITLEEGKVVSISNSVQRLLIPSDAKSCPNAILNKKYSSLRSVVVESLSFDYKTLILNNPQIEELIFNVQATIEKGFFDTLTSLKRVEFNENVTFKDEISPFKNLSKLKWLVLSGVDKTNFATLFGNNTISSLYYVVLKNMEVSNNYFSNVGSINSLSFVNCIISTDSINTKVSNVYFSSGSTYDTKVLEGLDKVASNVLFEGISSDTSKMSYTTYNNVSLKRYEIQNEGYTFTANMYFFSYIPSEMSSLFLNDSGYCTLSFGDLTYAYGEISVSGGYTKVK